MIHRTPSAQAESGRIELEAFISELEARWDDSLEPIRHVVLLDQPGVCRIDWIGEVFPIRDWKAMAAASIYIASEKDGGATVELSVRLCQEKGQDDPYAYVEWMPIKQQCQKLYKRLEAFGLFRSINQKGGRCKDASCGVCKRGRGHRATTTVVLGRLILAASGVQVFGMEADHLENSCGGAFGGFDTLDNRREVLQALTPEEHRRKARKFRRARGSMS
jgi:hypothetical protein